MPHLFPENPPSGIALFDLDGTLIAWDCQLLFRTFVLRRELWRGIFLPVFLAFLPLASRILIQRSIIGAVWTMVGIAARASSSASEAGS